MGHIKVVKPAFIAVYWGSINCTASVWFSQPASEVKTLKGPLERKDTLEEKALTTLVLCSFSTQWAFISEIYAER